VREPWQGETGGSQVPQPSAEARWELRSYVVGFGLSLLLTVAAFGLAVSKLLTGTALTVAVGLLGLVQIAVQFRFFLHIDLTRQKREDLQLILFTGLLILIMVAGSLWIQSSLDIRMMG
jgi:cytochrome o ubiquinol oxidase subunit IV